MTSHSDIESKARPYQKKAIEEIRSFFASGKKKVLLQLSTGGGKTFTFSMLLNAALVKGTRSIMVVKGRSLVAQASERLSEHGIDHSVFMSGDPRYDPSKLIQIVSVDTCRARSTYPEASLVVIDEAHTATSLSFKNFLEHYPESFWLGVTATPWTSCGLVDIADDVVYPISFEDLIAAKNLVEPRFFCPSKFDSSALKVVKGEFDDASCIKAFEDQKIYGDILGTYKRYCSDSVTWIFAINISHAEELKKFFENNFISSVIITGDTPIEYRKILLEREMLVISIGTLTTGVDLPKLQNIIMCRPTNSKNLYVQMLGRGTRPYKDKDHFKVFDHVGNYERFGDIRDEKKHELKPSKKKSKVHQCEAPFKICNHCSAVNHAAAKTCKECGEDFPLEKLTVKMCSIEMEELAGDLRSRIERRAEFHFKNVWAYASKSGAIWYRLKEDFGEDKIKAHNDIVNKWRAKYDLWKKDPKLAPMAYGYKRFGGMF